MNNTDDLIRKLQTLADDLYGDNSFTHWATVKEAIALARRQQAEIEALRKDAQKYRWLRDGCRSLKQHNNMERILANWMEWTPLEGDAAIDAALKGSET